jgi:dATP/dGTP diphosphohydrolase, N-terminal
VRLPTDADDRKKVPLATGLIDFFPDALVEIAKVSWLGSRQHNGDGPVWWDRSKSVDHADALMRHFVERGRRDEDGGRHTAKMAWRALAMLQLELEGEQG